MRTQLSATRRSNLAVALASVAIVLWATGLQPADAVTAVKRALSAKNADAVDKLSASKTPKPGQLLALGSDGKFPRTALPESGSRGPRGPEGPSGAPGQRGPSDGYVDNGAPTQLSTQTNVGTIVARLGNLPAGSYMVSAVAQAGDFTNGGEIVSCDIRVNGEGVGGSSVVVGIGAGSLRSAVLHASAGVTRSTPFDVTLDCRSDQSLPQPPGIQNQRLTAIQVASLRSTG